MDAEFVKEYAAKKKLTKYEQNVLLKMEEKAGAKNKNICDYSKEEILECLRGYNSRSINTLQKYASLLRQYIDYCIAHHKTEEKNSPVNHCREITKNDLMLCLESDVTIYHKMDLSLILEMADKMKNPADQFVILGSYEGLTLADILSLRAFDINYDEWAIYHPRVRRWFGHSDTLVRYGIKALQEYHYDAGDRSIELVDVDDRGPSVIKQSYYVSRLPDSHTINSRILRKASLIDAKFTNITPKIIHKFGLYEAINYYLDFDPLKIDDFFQNNNLKYRMLIERFDRELSRPSVMKNEYDMISKICKVDQEAKKYWDELIIHDLYINKNYIRNRLAHLE